MSLPLFYLESAVTGKELVLSEDASRHIVQVLRMQPGEHLSLTDGLGNSWLATISEANKKKTLVQINNHEYSAPSSAPRAIAISLIKNSSRFEWFLEKATEIGISEIIPLICQRTEKQHFRFERMNGILISALLQSRQVWMPRLSQPMLYEDLIKNVNYSRRFIAHCEPSEKLNLRIIPDEELSSLLLIGPEGDFSPEEISNALSRGFKPVSLGNTRLRTETAGIVGATLLMQA